MKCELTTRTLGATRLPVTVWMSSMMKKDFTSLARTRSPSQAPSRKRMATLPVLGSGPMRVLGARVPMNCRQRSAFSGVLGIFTSGKKDRA